MQTKHTWLHNLRFIFFIQVWWYSNPTFQCWSFCIVLHTQSGCRCHWNINSVMNSGTSGHGRFNAWSPTLGVSCGILSAAATGRVAILGMALGTGVHFCCKTSNEWLQRQQTWKSLLEVSLTSLTRLQFAQFFLSALWNHNFILSNFGHPGGVRCGDSQIKCSKLTAFTLSGAMVENVQVGHLWSFSEAWTWALLVEDDMRRFCVWA